MSVIAFSERDDVNPEMSPMLPVYFVTDVPGCSDSDRAPIARHELTEHVEFFSRASYLIWIAMIRGLLKTHLEISSRTSFLFKNALKATV